MKNHKYRLSLKPLLLWLLTALFGIAPLQGQTNSQSSPIVMTLEKEAITLGEPVLADIQMNNTASEILTFEIESVDDDNLAVTVTDPDGNQQEHDGARRPEAPGLNARSYLHPKFELNPGEKLSIPVVLNRWFEFHQIGKYRILMGLGSPATIGKTPVVLKPFSLSLEIAPRDPKQLAARCKALLERLKQEREPLLAYTGSYDYWAAKEALGYILDPVAVPYLEYGFKHSLLREGSVFYNFIDNLIEIGTPDAIAALIRVLAYYTHDYYERMRIREGLKDLAGKTFDPQLKAQIEKALKENDRLTVFPRCSLYGYIDKTGKMVIPPKFDGPGPGEFSEGLAFDGPGPEEFSEGLAAVSITNGPGDHDSGYIDKTGKMAIRVPLIFSGGKFVDGVARSDESKNGCYYIDKTGKKIFQGCGKDFSEELAAVWVGGKYGYIDPAGKMVIMPQYADADSFSEGLAAAIAAGDKWGYIDKSGKMIIMAQYTAARPFSEGLAAVRFETGDRGWGYIDTTGKMVIMPKYEDDKDFSEGLAAVQIGKKWGYIDKSGRMVIPPQYEEVTPFSEELAAVRVEGRDDGWGYIDKTGKTVVPPRYFAAEAFSEGLAVVRINNTLDTRVKYGYIDKTGKIVILVRDSYPQTFHEGLAAVAVGGHIDINEKCVVPKTKQN